MDFSGIAILLLASLLIRKLSTFVLQQYDRTREETLLPDYFRIEIGDEINTITFGFICNYHVSVFFLFLLKVIANHILAP